MLAGGVLVRVDAHVDGRALRRVSGRAGRALIALPSGVRVFIACGVTDMRKGWSGWPCWCSGGWARNPFDGAVYAFRGRRAGLIKLIWHDGIGLCMLTKRLEQGQFAWPSATSPGGSRSRRRNWRPHSTAANGTPRSRVPGRNWPGEQAHSALGATGLFDQCDLCLATLSQRVAELGRKLEPCRTATHDHDAVPAQGRGRFRPQPNSDIRDAGASASDMVKPLSHGTLKTRYAPCTTPEAAGAANSEATPNSTAVSAVMLTRPRTVVTGISICAGLAAPSKIGPTAIGRAAGCASRARGRPRASPVLSGLAPAAQRPAIDMGVHANQHATAA